MGRLLRLELENFKSYNGRSTIGPFHRFTAIIGPNGSGKSNLMDAISFVCGIASKHLRSIVLSDLISNVSQKDHGKQLTCSVTLVYECTENEMEECAEGQEMYFTRKISSTGHGSYAFNGKETTFEKYMLYLKSIGILTKARNFLVFQGDIENMANKKPLELTKLFEMISTSEEMSSEYKECLLEKNRAEEDTIFAYQKKKGLLAERKIVRIIYYLSGLNRMSYSCMYIMGI